MPGVDVNEGVVQKVAWRRAAASHELRRGGRRSYGRCWASGDGDRSSKGESGKKEGEQQQGRKGSDPAAWDRTDDSRWLKGLTQPVSMPMEAFLLLLSPTLVVVGVTAMTGLALGLDPLGNLHWDSEDVWLGLKLMLPALVLDAAVLTPPWDSIPGVRMPLVQKMRLPDNLEEPAKEGKDAQDRSAVESCSAGGSTDATAEAGTQGEGAGAASSGGRLEAAGEATPMVADAGDSRSSRSSAAQAAGRGGEEPETTETGAASGSGSSGSVDNGSSRSRVSQTLDAMAGFGIETRAEISEKEQEQREREREAAAQEEVEEARRQQEMVEKAVRVFVEQAEKQREEEQGQVLWPKRVLGAAVRLQQESAALAKGLSPLQYASRAVLQCLSQDMLLKAVLLVFLGHWSADRLTEAGLGAGVSAWGLSFSTREAGVALAAAAVLLLESSVAAYYYTRRMRMLTLPPSFKQGEREQTGEKQMPEPMAAVQRKVSGEAAGAEPAGEEMHSSIAQPRGKVVVVRADKAPGSGRKVVVKDVLPGMESLMLRTQQVLQAKEVPVMSWVQGLLLTRDLLRIMGTTAAFVATGNLAASWMPWSICMVLRSTYGLLNSRRLGDAVKAQLREVAQKPK